VNEDKLDFLLRHNRQIRVIGFDDAPFVRHTTEPVAIAGVICNLILNPIDISYVKSAIF
jgi:endonuclease V-like protein UPF0215 family